MMSIGNEGDSPQQQINEQSLRQDLEKNRESLKRKLQTRRSLKQLVDVGIISPLPFHEQHKQLQMRKTQDILRNKILSRPDRQLLIEHNILSDTIAAPAIQNTQRLLKRARLVDNLNDKLSVRPGILELVANNILEIDSDLKKAIQDGYIQYPSTNLTVDKQQSRSFRPKTSSFSNTILSKRSLGSISKLKSCLTFHEYKGPLRKVEITKVPVQLTRIPFKHNHKLTENHYKIQLSQQQLFLELIHNDKSIDNITTNVLQQPIDDNSQLFETMKLVDLKNECRKLNISSTGTKMKLIEKLKNARIKISDTTILPLQTINNELLSSQIQNTSLSSVKLLLSTSSLSDQELYQQQEQKLIELENQLEKLKQFDSSLPYQNQSSPTSQHIDNSISIPPKCNPILSVQIQKRILMQQQEKLKQKIQQHSIVPLTPESIARFLAQTSDHHSPSPFESINNETNSNDEEIILNLLDDYTDSNSISTLHSNDSYLNSTPSSHMDWMTVSSPSEVNEFYNDNHSDFTQFLDQFGSNDHHHLLSNSSLSTCHSFDLFSPSNSII